MKNWGWGAVTLAIVVVLFLLSSSFYVLHVGQAAVVLNLGHESTVRQVPGLYFKWPIVQKIQLIDTRLRNGSSEPVNVPTSTAHAQLELSFFDQWRVTDPVRFYEHGLDAALAQKRIDDLLKEKAASVFQDQDPMRMTPAQLAQGLDRLQQSLSHSLQAEGISLVGLQLLKVGLPQPQLRTVYRAMEQATLDRAKAIEASGKAKAAEIRDEADAQKAQILAEAYRKAQTIKGAAESEAAGIYAAASDKDPKFYAFYRSLEAYRQSLGSQDVLILPANSRFFDVLQHGMESTPR
ncbi:MAG: protease modulator HflC [Acidithiobacillus sp.]